MKQEKQIPIEYTLPTVNQKWKSYIIDFFSFILSFALLFSIFFTIDYHLPIYQTNLDKMDQVRLDSKLYEKNQECELDLVSNIYSTDNNYAEEEYKKHMSDALSYFFSKESGFFTIDQNSVSTGLIFYNNQKQESNLFEKTSEENSINTYIEKQDISDSEYIDFYKDCIGKSIGFLSNNETYHSSSVILLWNLIVSIIIAYVLSYLILFLLIPSILKRGYRTLGMSVAKYGKVYVNGLNPTYPRFLLYFLYNFIFICLSPLMLFIPLFISLGMSFYSKSNQSLPDYLSNLYIVNLSNSKIYISPYEYLNEIKN